MKAISTIAKKEFRMTFGTKESLISLLFILVLLSFCFLGPLVNLSQNTLSQAVFLSYIPLFQIFPVVLAFMVGQNAFSGELNERTIKFLLTLPIKEEEIFIGKALPCLVAGLGASIALSTALIAVFSSSGLIINAEVLITFFGMGGAIVLLASFVLIAFSVYFSGMAASFLPILVTFGIIGSVYTLMRFVPGSSLLKSIVITIIFIALSVVILRVSLLGFSRERLILKGG
jgi:ABC-type transport system involved in multi-copper enzyme maturation permease subunit